MCLFYTSACYIDYGAQFLQLTYMQDAQVTRSPIINTQQQCNINTELGADCVIPFIRLMPDTEKKVIIPTVL